eukprot:SAG31_NODE_4389_length_3277_cov_7.853682_2_plen_35_part_00
MNYINEVVLPKTANINREISSNYLKDSQVEESDR